MNYTKNNFPKLVSQPNKFYTYVVWGCASFLGIALLAVVLALPLAFQLEHGGKLTAVAVIFDVVYYAFFCWLIWKIFNSYQKTKGNRIEKIAVDQSGLHYHKRDGTVRSILYQDLEHSNEAYTSDIHFQIGTSIGRYSTPGYLFGFRGGKRVKLGLYNNNESGGLYIMKNKEELVAHFLKGIHLFRPDLTIYTGVFSHYHIHPETFAYDQKAHWKFNITVGISIILLLIIIDLCIYYFKGFSLLFNF